MAPSRIEKKAGDVVQNFEPGNRVGRNDSWYDATARPAPPARHHAWKRSRASAVTPASHSPSASPAKTKALHGNSVKVLRAGGGRRYHSIGSGTSAGQDHSRSKGVRTSTPIVTASGGSDPAVPGAATPP